MLVIQAANSLSDERTEFLISDRLSFMRFLGLGLSDRVPDARTIWLFREKLTKAGAIQALFDRFDAALRASGYIAKGMAGRHPSRMAMGRADHRCDPDCRAEEPQYRGGEERSQGRAHPGSLEGQAGQTPAKGSGRRVDREVLEGEGAA